MTTKRKEKAAELASILALNVWAGELDGSEWGELGYGYNVQEYMGSVAVTVPAPHGKDYCGPAWRKFWGEVHARIMTNEE